MAEPYQVRVLFEAHDVGRSRSMFKFALHFFTNLILPLERCADMP